LLGTSPVLSNDAMNKSVLLLCCFLNMQISFAQTTTHFSLAKRADSLYNLKEYKTAALTYSEACKIKAGEGNMTDRYNAACCWALANEPDSSFYFIDQLAAKMKFIYYRQIMSDPDLNSLHSDNRWIPLMEIIKNNWENAESHLNKSLVSELDSIYDEDQQYRLQIDDTVKKYGWQSAEVKSLWNTIYEKDSINLIKVKFILNKYGWLGAGIVGEQGNSTLFLVIQHADLATQENYLPMMRIAVKNGNAKASSLALLEDRVALREGKKQIYGSQIVRDEATQKSYVSPLEDPENVDKRRAEVGLEPPGRICYTMEHHMERRTI
jgi:hypothetical protein